MYLIIYSNPHVGMYGMCYVHHIYRKGYQHQKMYLTFKFSRLKVYLQNILKMEVVCNGLQCVCVCFPGNTPPHMNTYIRRCSPALNSAEHVLVSVDLYIHNEYNSTRGMVWLNRCMQYMCAKSIQFICGLWMRHNNNRLKNMAALGESFRLVLAKSQQQVICNPFITIFMHFVIEIFAFITLTS